METPPHAHGTVHSGIGAPVSHPFPPDAELHRAAEVLNAGKRVAMLVGAGALHATDELIQVAERLGAGVAKALLGKAALPDELPWVTGSIGLLGTKPSWDLMQNCDTLLMVGSGFPYSEFLPQEGKARGVQIDTSAGMLSLRYPMEVNLLGDSKATLRALLPLLQPNSDQSWRRDRGEERRGLVEAIAGTCHATRRSAQSAARVLGTLVAPARWRDHRQRLWLRRQLVRPRPAHPARHDVLTVRWSRQHGRRCALRDRRQVRPSGSPSLALVGDGAMQMNGMAELITVTKYWKKWGNPRFVVLVLNNRDLNQVTWEQRAQAGDPKFLASQSIPDVSYARFADLIGLKGIFVDNPDDVAGVWDEALSADRPVVVEAYTDPNVPPLPPHITLAQARAFAGSLYREPERGSVIVDTARDVLASVLPGRN